jgi:PPM family protein phosphatase
MEVGVATDIGAGQRSNDDAWCVEQLHPNVTLLAIADGFGRADGVQAAAIVVDGVREVIRRELLRATFPQRSLTPSNIRELLTHAFAEANDRLLSGGGSTDDHVAAASTCTAVLLVDDKAFIAHVGDSRAFLLRRNELVQLTPDESIVPEFVRSGGGKQKLARQTHVRRPLLTRVLGVEAATQAPPRVSHYTLHARDAVALCTDGAYRGVALSDLQGAFGAKESVNECAARVVTLARNSGGADNATVILVRDATIHGSPTQAAPRRSTTPRALVVASTALAVFIVATAGFVNWWIGDNHLYLSTDSGGKVTLYAGAPATFFGVPLHVTRKTYPVATGDLPADLQVRLREGLLVSKPADADAFVVLWRRP